MKLNFWIFFTGYGYPAQEFSEVCRADRESDCTGIYCIWNGHTCTALANRMSIGSRSSQLNSQLANVS